MSEHEHAAEQKPFQVSVTRQGAKEFIEAKIKSQGGFPEITKTKTAKVLTKGGREYSYKYADLSDILSAVAPVLHKNGLLLDHTITQDGASIRIETSLNHVSGFGEVSSMLIPADMDPQSIGGHITYFRRYMVCCMLGIHPDEDDDANSAHSPFTNQPKTQNNPKGML